MHLSLGLNVNILHSAMSWGSPVIWTGTSSVTWPRAIRARWRVHRSLNFTFQWWLHVSPAAEALYGYMMKQRLQTYSVSPGLTDLPCYFRSKNRWCLNCFGGEIGISSYINLPSWYFASGILLLLRNWMQHETSEPDGWPKTISGYEDMLETIFYQMTSPGLHLSKNWVVRR